MTEEAQATQETQQTQDQLTKVHDVQYEDEETKKSVDLPKVEVKTGAENLECIFKMRIKLYRFRDDQWKERGIGNAKLMRDRKQQRIRFLMRQEKTLKPVANFIISDICELTAMANNEKSWCWSAQDFSDGAGDVEKLAARFNTVDGAKEFRASFDAARLFNKLAKEGKTEELVWAATVEDLDEQVIDDIEINRTAGDEGDEGGDD